MEFRLNPVEILLRREKKFEVHAKKMNSCVFLFFYFLIQIGAYLENFADVIANSSDL